MAVLICIMGGLPNDHRVPSFTPRRYRNSKKTLYERHCTFIAPCRRTISFAGNCLRELLPGPGSIFLRWFKLILII